MTHLSDRQAKACRRPSATRQYHAVLFLFIVQVCWSQAAFLTPPLSSCHLHRATTNIEEATVDETRAVAVSRFTVEYDKLCKHCPTRLQPRVHTLTEMIMGLSVQERQELLAAVALREATNKVGLRTPKEVYDFQLSAATGNVMVDDGVVAGNETKQENKKQSMKRHVKMKENDEAIRGGEQQLSKAKEKMEKAQGKFMNNEMKLAHLERLLHVTTLLLARGKDAEIPNDEETSSLAKEIASLQTMTRQQLKLQRLKYAEKRAKYERNRAKCRVKRFAASLELSKVKARQAR